MTAKEILLEKLGRYRAVTLETLALVPQERLAWAPVPELFTFAQQFYHIFETEDYYAHGLLEEDWSLDRLRLPQVLPSRAEIRERLLAIREFTLVHLETLDEEGPTRLVAPPNLPVQTTLAAWLEFTIEHEIHHRSQTALYLRLIGITPPYFAAVVPENARPDIEARRMLDAGGDLGLPQA
jgi:uncharacterized damage-inducible protein DinB